MCNDDNPTTRDSGSAVWALDNFKDQECETLWKDISCIRKNRHEYKQEWVRKQIDLRMEIINLYDELGHKYDQLSD